MKTEIEITDRAFRPAEFRASSLNAEARTVNVVWSTGSPVKRFDWRESEYYLEALEMSTAAVNLDRLNGGAAPFLDNHARGGMADRLGAIVPGTARVEEGQGIATVVLSTSRSGQQIIDDLGHGLPLPVSVGYSVESYERTEGEGDALPTLLATRWTPMEISAVLIPADPDAQARQEPAESQRQTVPVTNRRARGAADSMENTFMTTTLTADPAEGLERGRADEIMTISDNHSIPLRLARKAVSEGKTVREFREMALDHRRREQDRTETFSVAPMDHVAGGPPLAERMADALLGRLQPRHTVTTGRDFVGASLGEMARHSLEQAGVSTRGMSTGKLIERASMHTTSDLPLMLDTVANRILRHAYDEQPSGLREAAKEQTARDFRTRFSIGLDLAGKLPKVNEHGEFKRLTINEGAEGYALATYGGVFAVTRQALINENLGYFAEMPAHFGKLAARLEAEQLTTLLQGTQKLYDGLAVYHATHGNLLAPAGLSTASLAAARLAMRRQKGAAGEVINIAPKFLVVPELELLGEQTLAAVNAEKVSDTNPFAGRLTLIVENNLEDARAWYVLAEQGASGLEYAYLEGEKGVQLMSRVGFDVDGQEWKARLDFGAGWVDYRGAVKNSGVAP